MGEPLVTVATFGKAVDAAQARDRLEQAGIKVFLAGPTAAGDTAQPPADTPFVALQVAATEAPEALCVLEDVLETAASLSAPVHPFPDKVADESPSSTRAEDARRAFRAAVLGLFFPPVQLWASLVLLQVAFSREKLEARPRRQAVIAAVINVSVYLFVILLFLSPWINRYPGEVNPLLFAHPREMAGTWVHETGATELELRPNGRLRYLDLEEPNCEFSGTWGLGDFVFVFNVSRLTKPGHGFESGRSYSWQLSHFNEREIVLHDAFRKWKYVRKAKR
jgi:hypothetical protein